MRLLPALVLSLASTFWPITPPSAAAPAPPLHITLDPGHGGNQIGTSFRFSDGTVLQEKTLNLQVALILRQLLERAGFVVSVTRTSVLARSAVEHHRPTEPDARDHW
jgi:N-acetylmuramoyl-L-alanine amidase